MYAIRSYYDGAPAGGAAGLRQVIDLEPVHLAAAGEAQDGVVGVGHQHALDEVFILHAGRRLAATTTALGLVITSYSIHYTKLYDHEIFARFIGREQQSLPTETLLAMAQRHDLLVKVEQLIIETIVQKYPSYASPRNNFV